MWMNIWITWDLVEMQILVEHSRGRAWDSAFLACSWVMLMCHEPHWCSKLFGKLSSGSISGSTREQCIYYTSPRSILNKLCGSAAGRLHRIKKCFLFIPACDSSSPAFHMMYYAYGGFPSGSVVKNLPKMHEPQKMQVWSLGWEEPLEEGMTTHSSILAWRIPWTEERGGLQSIGSQRVG